MAYNATATSIGTLIVCSDSDSIDILVLGMTQQGWCWTWWLARPRHPGHHDQYAMHINSQSGPGRVLQVSITSS